MRYLVAALVFLAAPAFAAVSDGMWHSADMSVQVSFHGMEFTKYLPNDDTFVQCEIVDWPISSPAADAECDDGSTHSVVIGEGTVVFDGTPLTQTMEALD